ncbi:MAG TPA: AAA family ATPase, partial [Candidatus Acidoferrum sp.]|nr:AAA family ATPase [Candidatus Acidoferrum sp.]
ILEKLWPDTFVNPEVVKKYVLEIRKVLGDKSGKPTFVSTFPRRGYQFIATVSEGEAAGGTETSGRSRKTVVGRDAALAELKDALARATAGQRQIVFVTGEAGIGKTTLLDTFQQEALAAPRSSVARGHCVEGFGGKEAYYPVLDAFGQLLRGADEHAVLQILAKRAPTWLMQFPHLVNAEQRGELEKQILGATRERMVREMCEAIEVITERNPLVLCLEDLHWVDPSTLDLLSAIARRRSPAKLLIIATYRPADVIVSQSPLKALKQDLVVHELAREISLERLEEHDVSRYIKLEFGQATLPKGFAAAIYRQSGGNALFMVAILQDLAKKGLLSKSEGAWVFEGPLSNIAREVPETLDQLIEVQFQQLSGIEQRILRAASVAGEHFSVWTIQSAAELEMTEIENACEGLVERCQFLKFGGLHELADEQVSAHYDFQHSFYREVLYRRLSEVSRSRLHLLVAERLKSFCDPCDRELATELALHFEGGHDYEQATYHLILAAENAMRRFSYRDSIEILKHALELVAKLNATRQGKLEIKIMESIGDAHFALGVLADSAQAYSDAAARAGQLGLRSCEVHALVRAMYPLGGINPDQGLNAMKRAVETSNLVGDPRLNAYTQLLSLGCHMVFDDFRQSDADLYRSNLTKLQELGDSSAEPLRQMIHGHVLSVFGEYRRAIEAFENSVCREDPSSSLITSFGALSGRTFALLRLGNFGEVLRLIRAGKGSLEENRTLWWLLSVREAWLRLAVFDYAGATEICAPICEGKENFREGSEQYRSAQPRAIAEMAAGYTALQRREFRQAIGHFSHVHRPEVPTKYFLHWLWRHTAHLELGNAWLQAGDINQAESVSANFLDAALQTSDPQLQASAWELRARVAMAKNDAGLARDQIDNALAVLAKFEIPTAAWPTFVTASDIYSSLKEEKRSNVFSETARNEIFKIADSFAPDEPLRASFLAAEPVRRALRHEAHKRTRQVRAGQRASS